MDPVSSPVRFRCFRAGARWYSPTVNVALEGSYQLEPVSWRDNQTGTTLLQDELTASQWPLARSPHLLETSLPGVFVVGDVRADNIKRVASAVGEGSIAVSFVHQMLHE